MGTTPTGPNVQVSTNGKFSFAFKDISDWAKVIVLLFGLGMAYERISYQITDHTQQLEDIKAQMAKDKASTDARSLRLYKKMGAIEFYLCSKDSSHCKYDDDNNVLPPTAP